MDQEQFQLLLYKDNFIEETPLYRINALIYLCIQNKIKRPFLFLASLEKLLESLDYYLRLACSSNLFQTIEMNMDNDFISPLISYKVYGISNADLLQCYKIAVVEILGHKRLFKAVDAKRLMMNVASYVLIKKKYWSLEAIAIDNPKRHKVEDRWAPPASLSSPSFYCPQLL